MLSPLMLFVKLLFHQMPQRVNNSIDVMSSLGS